MTILGLEDRVADRVPITDYVQGRTNYTAGTSDYSDNNYSYSISFHDVETKHQVPDASFSDNRDEVYIMPEQCGYGTEYMIFRPTENVGEPLELEEGFYYAHMDELDGIEEALQSMHDIKIEMAKYEASGDLERLIEFAQENGTNTYILRQPDYYGATSEGMTIAYTYYHKHIPDEKLLLGAGKNFYDACYRHGTNFGLHPDYGIIDAITEELLHQVQPEWMYDMVVEHGYMELLEGHVKALKSKYFFERVNEAPDEDTRMSYWLLSLNNYSWYRQLMKQHIELYGIEMDEEALEEMLDTYSPEDMVKELSKGATREPDRCVDGGYGYAAKSRNKSKANSKIGKAALIVEKLGNYLGSKYDRDTPADGQDDDSRYDSDDKGYFSAASYNCDCECGDAKGEEGSDESDGEGDSSDGEGQGNGSDGDSE